MPAAPPIAPPGYRVATGSNRIVPVRADIMPGLDSHSFAGIVPAGQSLPLPIRGIGFYFVALDSPGLNVRANSGGNTRSIMPFFQGTGLKLGNGYFDILELQNAGAANVAFIIAVTGGTQSAAGVDEYIDRRTITQAGFINLAVQNGTTTAVSYNTRTAGAFGFSILNGAIINITDGYLGMRRKQIILCNDDANLILYALDVAGNRVGTIQPQSAFTFESGGTVSLYNPNGQALNCGIAEIYYT